MHNALADTYHAAVSIGSKVEDNVLCVIIVPVITLQPATPSNLATNPPHILLKAPSSLAIKHVCMPSSKLRAAKLQPELAKA